METNGIHKIIRQRILDGILVVEHALCGFDETLIFAECRNHEDFADFLQRAGSACIPSDAFIVCQDIFGPPVSDRSLKEPGHPVTWITPLEEAPPEMTGTQIWAIRGRPVDRIIHKGRIVGSIFEDDHTRCCRLGGLGISEPQMPRGIQAQHTFLEMQQVLSHVGMDFHHVMRTWFYNDDILDWYEDFNRVRTQYFMDHYIRLSEFPASTGIGAGNPSGSALTAGLLAVAPKGPDTAWKTVPSPMQENPAEYGSSFSRAAELVAPDYRRLFISGTASISYGGCTVHQGDICRQIELTMEAVQSILRSRDMGWTDVIRGLAYFKESRFFRPWINWCKKHSIFLPHCRVFADICRPDLLFEFEVDAVTNKY